MHVQTILWPMILLGSSLIQAAPTTAPLHNAIEKRDYGCGPDFWFNDSGICNFHVRLLPAPSRPDSVILASTDTNIGSASTTSPKIVQMAGYFVRREENVVGRFGGMPTCRSIQLSGCAY